MNRAIVSAHLEKKLTADQLINGYQISDVDIARGSRQIDAETTYEAFKRAITKEKEIMFRKQIQDGDWDDNYNHLAELRKQCGKKNTKITEWILITVNCDDAHQNIRQLKKKVEKYVKRSFIVEYIYNFEQRSESEPYLGIHSHILVRQNCRDGDKFRKSTLNTFKSLVGNNMAINFRYISSTPEQAIPYITGVKKDDKKNAKIVCDAKWRTMECLKQFYYTDKKGIISNYLDGE